MFPLWSAFVFALLALVGAFLLVKSIGGMISVYQSGPRFEHSARMPAFSVELPSAGAYEIAVKRPYLTGIIPSNVPFRLTSEPDGESVAVQTGLNLLSQRKDFSGNRIVPVAGFSVDRPGRYRLTNPSVESFREKDQLLIMPRTGSKGFLLIFGILGSAFLFIGGTVLFILTLIKR
ncbi:hypothetical protein [Larkinella soli]|uniref:hypothetical protein n=1 Tax=Larkinella soli TaxID=1770527 RepID=UPI000FFB8FC4|nr:hypothetical protein [Larkinella soli]